MSHQGDELPRLPTDSPAASTMKDAAGGKTAPTCVCKENRGKKPPAAVDVVEEGGGRDSSVRLVPRY